CEKTFEWGSLRILHKIPRTDAFVIVAVTIVTVLTDLATAVVAGVIIGALAFAWNQAKELRVSIRVDEKNRKVYELSGTVFFASAAGFQALFSPKEDPAEVVVEFSGARVADHSGIEAVEQLAQRYLKEGKTLHLRHLSPACRELLGRAKSMVEVNSSEDPHYLVADNR
ncbi:MAG: SulP family inorganic anion transporter, partial [Proteobacteria bacterium]